MDKVSDAKAAFERKSSLVASNEKKSEFNLASTVNVNKLIENELKMAEKTEKEQKTKTESEEKVINYFLHICFYTLNMFLQSAVFIFKLEI